jgi:GMP synthase (glutamine-hydrolysing)
MNAKKESLAREEFVRPLCSIVGELEQYEVMHYTEVQPEMVNTYNKIILSGTPLQDNEFRSNIQLFKWIKTCNRPILGICAGLQMIGLVFDSILRKCPEIGLKEIKTINRNVLHNYAIEPSSAFEVIAQSENCVHGIKHTEKELYGILFHPEVRNKEIVERFIRTID